MLRCCYVTGQGLGGVGWDINVNRRGCYAAATSLVRGWVGWGGILTFIYHAYRRGCYAAATSLVRGWVGWGGILTFMYHAYRRGCYAAATSGHWSGVGCGGVGSCTMRTYVDATLLLRHCSGVVWGGVGY